MNGLGFSSKEAETLNNLTKNIPDDPFVVALKAEMSKGDHPLMVVAKTVSLMCTCGFNEDKVIAQVLSFMNAGLAASIDTIASEVNMVCEEGGFEGRVEIQYSKM